MRWDCEQGNELSGSEEQYVVCNLGKDVQASGKVGTSSSLRASLAQALAVWLPIQTCTLVPDGWRKAQDRAWWSKGNAGNCSGERLPLWSPPSQGFPQEAKSPQFNPINVHLFVKLRDIAYITLPRPNPQVPRKMWEGSFHKLTWPERHGTF